MLYDWKQWIIAKKGTVPCSSEEKGCQNKHIMAAKESNVSVILNSVHFGSSKSFYLTQTTEAVKHSTEPAWTDLYCVCGGGEQQTTQIKWYLWNFKINLPSKPNKVMLHKQDMNSKQLGKNILIGILPSILFSQVVNSLVSPTPPKKTHPIIILKIILEKLTMFQDCIYTPVRRKKILQHQSIQS